MLPRVICAYCELRCKMKSQVIIITIIFIIITLLLLLLGKLICREQHSILAFSLLDTLRVFGIYSVSANAT